MKKIRAHEMTLAKWLDLARSSDVRARVSAELYSDPYPCLVEHFKSFKFRQWSDALVALYLVYGWMPTIPNSKGEPRIQTTDEKEEILRILRGARDGTEIETSAIARLMLFTNNSVIGASKMLHFINPELYPMWDKNVAKAFLWRTVTSVTVNNRGRWDDYREALSAWAKDAEVQSLCEELRTLGDNLQTVSRLRLLELVLFVEGKGAQR